MSLHLIPGKLTKHTFLMTIVALCCALNLSAQSKTYKNEAGYEADNDGFLGQGSDRYYTAGNFFFFRHALTVNDSSSIQNKVLGFELGQRIYTPQSAYVPGPAYIDRPFAGYTYFSTSINLLYKNESNLRLEAQVAVVGPNSYGQQVQDLIHKVFDFYQPGGWQYQIANDYELNLSAQYNRLIARTHGFDISANSYLDLGTGIDGAGLGFTARFGRFNQLYNSAITTSSVSARKMGSNRTEIFFFAKPSINYVAYSSTIQGSIFESAPAIYEIELVKKPYILSEQLGGMFVTGHWEVNASATYQTRETVLMIHPGHQWGSIAVLYRFN